MLVRDLNITLKPGGALLVYGPNGVGKTSLLRCVAGWITPVGGEVLRSESLAYIGHHHALKKLETPRQSLHFWSLWKGRGLDRIDHALEVWGLTSVADRPASRLSAGQKRRAVLARLELGAHTLWLLDEPTSALDKEGEAILASRLAHHRHRGGFVLAATHMPLDWPDVQILEMCQESKTAKLILKKPEITA